MPERPLDAQLLEAALRASHALDLGRFVESCAEGIGTLVGAEAVHTYLRTGAGKDLELQASWTPAGASGRRPHARIDGRAISQAGDGVARADPARLRPDGGSWWSPGEIGSDLLLVAIGKGRDSHGVLLAAADPDRGAFSDEEVARAAAYHAAVEPALRNIAYVDALRETALRDDIAECYNRRHFESFLGEEVARAKRFHSPLSVLFLDMDNLKDVNSAHGHSMGSRTLQEVSQRINAGIRKIDKLFRFGGDEFCIVLPETDTHGACEVGARLRGTIADRPMLAEEVGGITLTASLGIATYPVHGTTAQSLVEAADSAMRRVKGAGKNAVGTAEPAGPAGPAETAPSPRGPGPASPRATGAGA